MAPEFPVGVGLRCGPHGGRRLHFVLAFIFVRLLIGSRFLFWLNAKPVNPSTTKTAPATIIQCGYSSSKSKRSIQVKPVILKQALDFKQLGHDRVACHRGMVDDSSAARAIKTAPFAFSPNPCPWRNRRVPRQPFRLSWCASRCRHRPTGYAFRSTLRDHLRRPRLFQTDIP
jgi:hypothetical protein